MKIQNYRVVFRINTKHYAVIYISLLLFSLLTMARLPVVIVVMVAVIVQIEYGGSIPQTGVDIQQFLLTLQQQLQNEQLHHNQLQHAARPEDDSRDDYEYRDTGPGLLRSSEQLELIGEADDPKSMKQNWRSLFEVDSDDNNLRQLLSQQIQTYNTKKLRPKSNGLLGSVGLASDNDGNISESVNKQNKLSDLGDLRGFSKVYLILDSEAVQKSRNKKKLNDLLSSVLSSSARGSKKHRVRSDKQYQMRRAIRQSKEVDSMEKEYKPKRSRGDYGGGGSGGRTAIPYIGNRGDIYERNRQ